MNRRTIIDHLDVTVDCKGAKGSPDNYKYIAWVDSPMSRSNSEISN